MSALFAFNPSPIKIKLHLRPASQSAQFYGSQTFLLAFFLPNGKCFRDFRVAFLSFASRFYYGHTVLTDVHMRGYL